jgi:hypothetical protein
MTVGAAMVGYTVGYAVAAFTRNRWGWTALLPALGLRR